MSVCLRPILRHFVWFTRCNFIRVRSFLMRNWIILLVSLLSFVQCRRDKYELSTGIVDTLGVQWTTLERNNIVYYFQGTDEWSNKDIGDYADRHENAYDKINEVFKAQLPRKLRFFIWNDTALARQKLNRTLGFAQPDQCICNVRPNQTLGHEMTHILAYWGWGTTPLFYSRFVNEGIAVAFDQSGGDRIEGARSAVTGKGISTTRDVWEAGNSYSEAVLYPLAGAFMEYLYKQNIPDKFGALIKNQTVENADSIYGKAQMDKIIADFDQQVGL